MAFSRTLTALAIVLGLGATPALAQEQAALDSDQNNQISEDEWTAFGDESFDEVDADDSGAIDENEFNDYSETNWGGAPGGGDDDGPLWGLLDVNDDAEVTEDEWFSEDTFAELDDDESGALDDDEFGV